MPKSIIWGVCDVRCEKVKRVYLYCIVVIVVIVVVAIVDHSIYISVDRFYFKEEEKEKKKILRKNKLY